MGIDWGIVATIASPLVALVVGFFLTRTLNRPVVTAHLGHTSAHRADAVAGALVRGCGQADALQTVEPALVRGNVCSGIDRRCSGHRGSRNRMISA